MKYRLLGKTGLNISEIGLGCEAFVEKDQAFTDKMLDLAVSHGVNYIDMYSPEPGFRRHVGRYVGKIRDKFYLQSHLCSVWKDGQYKATRDLAEVKQGFEDMLEQLGTDYIDVGMIHYIDAEAVWDEINSNGVMDYVLSLKKEGRIHFTGVSSHNPKIALKMVESGLIDVLMFSVNPCYDLQPGDEDIEKLWADESYEKPLLNMDPDRQALYETCQRLGVGITVMKAFGGGDLLSDESPAGKALTVDQCIHYALTRPGVVSVMTGARDEKELLESLGYETASDEQRDYASALASFPKISWKGHCMYCGHCAPCLMGISVADVTKFLNLAKAKGGLPETEREHYASLAHHAGECVECGACVGRCPFEVDVISNMREAVKIFGK